MHACRLRTAVSVLVCEYRRSVREMSERISARGYRSVPVVAALPGGIATNETCWSEKY